MQRSSFLCVVLGAGFTALSGSVVRVHSLWPAQGPQRQATVPLRLETSDGRACNGVRLDDRLVATAAHCVQIGDSVTVIENGVATRADAVVVNPGYAFEPVETAAGADLARLTAAGSPGRFAPVAIGAIQPGPAQALSLSQSSVLHQTVCTYLGRSGALVVQNGVPVGIVNAWGSGPEHSVVQMADAMRLASF